MKFRYNFWLMKAMLVMIMLMSNCQVASANIVIRIIDQLGEGQVKETVSIELNGYSKEINLDQQTPSMAVDFSLPSPGQYHYSILVRTKVENKWFNSKCSNSGVLQIQGGEMFGLGVKSDPRDGNYECFLGQIKRTPPQAGGYGGNRSNPPSFDASSAVSRSSCMYNCTLQNGLCKKACWFADDPDVQFDCDNKCDAEQDSCQRMCY